MGRPRKPSRRYHITLDIPDADLLDAQATEQGKPSTTMAALLLVQTLRATDAAEPRRSVNATARPVPSRWEWPIADLLADQDWWARWLPRLNELMGRPLAGYAARSIAAMDDRGYADLLPFLFPPVRRDGRVVATWSSPDYPDQVQHDPAFERLRLGAASPTRSSVWEPVIRHVAEALSALEQTGAAGADAVLRIHVEDDLAGGWLQTLRRLIGDHAPDLPASPP